MSTHRPVVISCDGHASGRPEDYAPYIEKAFQDDFDEWLQRQQVAQEARRRARDQNQSLFSKEGSEAFEAATGDDRDGEWDSATRTRVMDTEGVVLEVLFPNTTVPFGAFGENAPQHLRGAGNRAYDRWLLDFANDDPARRAPLAMLTAHDLDETVAEITWAADVGMAGFIVPTKPGAELPPWYDPMYDVIWAACQDTGLPVHFHGGGGTPDYGDYGVVSMLMYATEATYFSRRPLFELLWGGVFERFPELTVVFTETRADWVPGTLMFLDGIHSAPFFSHIRDTVTLRPSEYFQRQCYVAASFMGPDESAMRHDIGLDKLMWGADYPHVEGTWPHTRRSLARCFRDVPLEEATTILTDNPARVYGFDIDALQPIADEICPTVEELVGSG